MNTEKRTEAINEASKLIASRAEVELHSIYMKGYHEGRHDYRNSIKDYLIINPKLREELKNLSKFDCRDCINYSHKHKIGCTSDPAKCYYKQNQLVAIDILKHYE